MKKLLSLGLLSCFAAYATNLDICFTMDSAECKQECQFNVSLDDAGKACWECETCKINFEAMPTEEADCIKLQCSICTKSSEGTTIVSEPVVNVRGTEAAHVVVTNEDNSCCSLTVKATE